MSENASNVSIDSLCIDLREFEKEEFAEITKWISLIEAVAIVILNSVLIGLLCRRKRPSRMAFFVHHLAVADLLVGLIYVLPECIFSRFMNSWEKFSCYILYGCCANLTIYASTFLIVVLTIDRLYVIVRPLSASTTGKKYRYGLVSGAWILAIILAIPYALHIKFVCTTHGNMCGHDFPNIEVMVLVELAVNLIIPVSIIAFCYLRIFLTIWRREQSGSGCSAPKVRYSNALTTAGKFQNIESSHSSVITKAKKKTIQVLFVVVIVYILSSSPINVAQVLNVFSIIESGDAYSFLHVLSPLNSLMNPLIFICFNRQMFKTEKSKYTGYTTTCHNETECDRV